MWKIAIGLMLALVFAVGCEDVAEPTEQAVAEQPLAEASAEAAAAPGAATAQAEAEAGGCGADCEGCGNKADEGAAVADGSACDKGCEGCEDCANCEKCSGEEKPEQAMGCGHDH